MDEYAFHIAFKWEFVKYEYAYTHIFTNCMHVIAPKIGLLSQHTRETSFDRLVNVNLHRNKYNLALHAWMRRESWANGFNGMLSDDRIPIGC